MCFDVFCYKEGKKSRNDSHVNQCSTDCQIGDHYTPSETSVIADHDGILNQTYKFICYKKVACTIELLAYARRVPVQNKTTMNVNRNRPITQLFYFKPVHMPRVSMQASDTS